MNRSSSFAGQRPPRPRRGTATRSARCNPSLRGGSRSRASSAANECQRTRTNGRRGPLSARGAAEEVSGKASFSLANRIRICDTNRVTKLVSVRIEEELLKAVDEITNGEARPRADAVREALEAWVREKRTAELVRRHREGYERKPVGEREFSPVLDAQLWPK